MRKIVLSGLLMVLIVGISEAVRLGVGYTFDTGLHIRIGRFEPQIIFGDVSLYGARFYGIEKTLIEKQTLDFYAGCETDLVNSNLLDGGYVAGVFSGLDKAIYKNLHLDLDLGIYTITLKGFETVNDIGVAINTKVTWYLGGKKR
jgi:hypothetical protein